MRARALPLALAATLAASGALPAPVAHAAPPERRIALQQWGTGAELRAGTARGVEVRRGRLVMAGPVARTGRQERATWTSPWVRPGFRLTELIPSWRGSTPGASSLKVQVRGRVSGSAGSWDTIARWAYADRAVRRASGGGQPDDLGRVAYDTWITPGVAAYQVRVSFLRPVGGTARPSLDTLDVMASRLPAVSSVTTSSPQRVGLGRVLPVPRYSQMVHAGEYPEYDGGGEAWCSPTSTTMVLAHFGALPAASKYAWVDDRYADPEVDHAARWVYDARLGGTGNWAFNTAYAAGTVPQAFVTRLRSLNEAQRFIDAGIPLVASLTFGAGALSGAPLSSSNGHLVVIVGFRDNGDVVVNDPAARTRAGVRRTYDRGDFEDAWLKRYSSGGSTRGSGGLVYVIRDAAHPLPERGRNRNW